MKKVLLLLVACMLNGMMLANHLPFTGNGYGTMDNPYELAFVGDDPVLQQYTITASANPTEGGTVTGAGNYDENATCTLTANANAGYVFTNWTENGQLVSTAVSYSFNVTGDRALVANFETTENHWNPVPGSMYSNSTTIIGVILINGIEHYTDHLELAVFSGDECRGTCRPEEFFLTHRYLANVNVYGEVDDELTFKLYDHSLQQEFDLTSPASVLFTDDGYGTPIMPYELDFIGENPYPQFTVTASVTPEIVGSVEGTGDYGQYTLCTVTAIPYEGFAFACWVEDGVIVSTDPTYSFVVYDDVDLEARFTLQGIINFQDSYVKEVCVANWDLDGDGELSYVEAALVTHLNNAFQGNTNIVTFGEFVYFFGLSSIEDYAFYNCESLQTIVLPYMLTAIGSNAFNNCYNLMTIGSYTLVPPVIADEEAFAYSYEGTLYVPCGTMDAYQAAPYWENFTTMWFNGISWVEQDGLRFEIIDTRNHYLAVTGFANGVTSAQNLVIPSTVYVDCAGRDYTVTKIADNAFYQNTNLTGTITFPSTLTEIGSNAFGYCSGLTGDLVFPASLTTIRNSSFNDCTGLNGTLTIPENVTWIGMRSFVNCRFTRINFNAINCESMGWDENHEYIYYVFWLNSNLEEIVIGENVTQIPDYAFGARNSQNCHLTFLGNAVTSIGDYAFYHDEADDLGLVGELHLPSSVTTIGYRAFANCSGLTGDLVIPENVDRILGHAFINCNFTSIHYNATNCTSIGYNEENNNWNYAFWRNLSLEEIVIGDNVIQIPSCAFTNHYSHHCHLTIGNSVQTINSGAFSSYTDLQTNPYPGLVGALVIPASVTAINENAFNGCTGLTEIWSMNSSAPSILNNTFVNISRSIPLHVPCGSLDNYQNASYWSEFTNYSENPHVLIVKSGNEYLGNASIVQYGSCSGDDNIVHAEAYVGCLFNNWTTLDGTVISNEAEYAFSPSEDITLVANFTGLENHHLFIGAGDWNDVNNWDPMELPTATSTVGIFGPATLYGEATVASAGIYNNNILTIYPEAALTVTGTLNTIGGAQINIQDGGQLYHASQGVNATLAKSITSYTPNERDGWHLIASPIAGIADMSSVTNLISNDYDLYYYDEPTVYWINQEDSENNFNALENAKGYLYANSCAGQSFEAQIGEGTSTTGYFPFYTLYNYSIAECLFLAEELANAGVTTTSMTSLSWYATNATGYNQQGITIWMANVNDETLAGASHIVTSMTKVYTGNITPAIGWNEFVFNEGTFSWDGHSNVLIYCQRNNGEWNSTVKWQATSGLDFNCMAYNYQDSGAYDPTIANTMNTSTTRPNIIFKAQGSRDASTTISFIGSLQDGSATIAVPLSYEATMDEMKGFNLVGNPFAHNVTSYSTVNVAEGCFRMNENKDDLIVSEITEEEPLKPAEGFFVKATDGDASLTFNPTRGSVLTKSSSIRVEVLKDSKLIDRLLVKNAERQPLEKFSLNEQRTKVYAIQDRKELAIVPCEGNEQPVNFKAAKNGNYTLSVNADGMEFTYLHLIDNLTGNDVDLLTNPNYSFEAKTTDYATRFKLVFATDSSVDTETDSFAFIDGNGNLTLYGIEGEATLQVVDLLGHVLSSQEFSGSYSKKLDVATGTYVLRLIQGNDIKVQKMVVK